MSKVIFKEADRHQTARYKVTGDERAIIVRSDMGAAFSMEISSVSLEDSHFRLWPWMTVNISGDYPFPMINEGMELVFRIDGGIDPNSHLFVEVV